MFKLLSFIYLNNKKKLSKIFFSKHGHVVNKGQFDLNSISQKCYMHTESTIHKTISPICTMRMELLLKYPGASYVKVFPIKNEGG